MTRSRTSTDLPFDSAVVVSPFFWNFREDMMQTTHYVAQELARVCPTVLVEPPAQWSPSAEQFRAHRLLSAVGGRRLRTPLPQLSVFHRRGFPFARIRALRNFDLRRNVAALRTVLREQGFRRTLLWHSFPYSSEPFVDAVAPAVFAYHCLDHSTQPEEEAALVRRADVAFAVSETLATHLARLNPRSHLLPNGVDTALFDPTDPRTRMTPGDLPTRGRHIGFIGLINQHLNLELILDVARAYPDDNVILLGRLMTKDTAPKGRQALALRTLLALPNVRHLGFKPPRELPMYLNAFDVCVMAFVEDPFNEGRDPLKFYQYLAMGKPIVTTPVAVARRFKDLCYVAESSEEFAHQIAVAFNEDLPTLTAERMAAARAHSWHAVMDNAYGILRGVQRRETPSVTVGG